MPSVFPCVKDRHIVFYLYASPCRIVVDKSSFPALDVDFPSVAESVATLHTSCFILFVPFNFLGVPVFGLGLDHEIDRGK